MIIAKPAMVIVTGLGRCGLTVTMNMLHAAGWPCFGTPPAWEDVPATNYSVLMRVPDGYAVKIVDPRLGQFARQFHSRVVFLTRDPLEQARSQIKIVESLFGDVVRPGAVKKMTKAIKRHTVEARAIMRRVAPGAGMMEMSFEDIIRTPALAAERLAEFVGLDRARCADMAAVVLARGTACLPNLDVELRMAEEAR